MMYNNLFLVLPDELNTLSLAAQSDDQHPLHELAKTVESHPDASGIAPQLKPATIKGETYHLRSAYLKDAEEDGPVHDRLAEYPGVIVGGAWDKNGQLLMEINPMILLFFTDKYRYGINEQGHVIDQTLVPKNLITYFPGINHRAGQMPREMNFFAQGLNQRVMAEINHMLKIDRHRADNDLWNADLTPDAAAIRSRAHLPQSIAEVATARDECLAHFGWLE